jgi:lipopolysaccharide export system permease protein
MSRPFPITLGFYLGKKFLQTVLLTLLCLFGLVFLIDLVELLRRAGTRDFEVPFTLLLEMAMLKSPQMSLMLLPYAVLIGMMLALARLTRTSELIVTRAAGVSVWQFLAPGLLLMVALGTFFLMVVSPLSATMLARYERLEAKALSGQTSLLAVSSSGLWLRQQEKDHAEVGEYIIHALRVSEQGERLSDVTVFVFDKQKSFLRRLQARSAELQHGEWVLQNVTVSRPGHPPERKEERRLPTTLTITQIQDSFASPETLSFWELPPFISTLEEAGFSALRHKLYWHRMISIPLLLAGMVMLAALFSMRLPRRGGVLYLISAGLLTGFVLLFISDIIYALGLSGSLPLWLAAWMPPMACALTGTALLLHFEDG